MTTRVNRNRFELEMIKQCLTLAELAKKSGVSYNTLCGVRNGRSCSAKTAGLLARALNVPVEELIEQ